MLDTICLDQYSKKVNESYVGFGLYKGRKVKPVHVANGIFRVLYGKILNNDGVKKLALVESKRGIKGYDTAAVRQEFVNRGCLEDDIREEEFDAARRVIQKLLDADSAVFIDKSRSDHMLSFSLSSKYFITSAAMYEDAGEFIGCLIREACPDLADYIISLLNRADDPISQLFTPVASDEISQSVDIENKFSALFPEHMRNKAMKRFTASIKIGGECFLRNLRKQPNTLTQLRLFNIFCMFSLFRYIAYLESFCTSAKLPPVLLDFSGGVGSIADASSTAYANIRRSLSRFCSWVYAKILEEDYTVAQLKCSDAPVRKAGKVSPETRDALESIWQMAKEDAGNVDGNDAYIVFGRAINNILARETDFHPGNYIRAVGLLSGILYPPNSSNNRFVISQDVLEMLLMCTVDPEAPISGSMIREYLWERCGVLIGGTSFEESVLHTAGVVFQADADALEQNFNNFSHAIEELGFADVKADGILQIHLGGA